jgi:hypothetical protein
LDGNAERLPLLNHFIVHFSVYLFTDSFRRCLKLAVSDVRPSVFPDSICSGAVPFAFSLCPFAFFDRLTPPINQPADRRRPHSTIAIDQLHSHTHTQPAPPPHSHDHGETSRQAEQSSSGRIAFKSQRLRLRRGANQLGNRIGVRGGGGGTVPIRHARFECKCQCRPACRRALIVI